MTGIKKEILSAVRNLGYKNITKDRITVEAWNSQDRYSVYIDEDLLGIWDSQRKTFVD